MEVIIDGERYEPAGSSTPSIGVGIKTRNRRDVLTATLPLWREHLPDGAVLVIVDDASKKPVDDADYRFDENVGIAVASNKCLELLAARGVEHFFLADDDTYPLTSDWWRPYVDSPEPHLMAMYDRPAGAKKAQLEVLYKDDQHVAYHQTRGYFLYAHRAVLDTVGGMDPAYGLWGWEHASWSDRIHAAGLTTHRYTDVVDSDSLIYSMDEHGEVTSTASADAKRFAAGPGYDLRMESRHSSEYIEYRDLDDIVLTCLLTGQDDPQRGRPLKADPKMVKALHDSLAYEGRFVIVHTSLDENRSSTILPNADFFQVTQCINPYFERWLHYYQWLRDHPNVGRVWCVDATDVEMTNDPFPEMEPGYLYFGYEPTTLSDDWMVSRHPDSTLQEFMADNANLPLLNMGVVGGHRDIVMAFAQKVVGMYFDDAVDFIMGWEHGRVNDDTSGDMAAGNYIARTHYNDRISTGPHVTNVFKSNVASPTAWWKHK